MMKTRISLLIVTTMTLLTGLLFVNGVCQTDMPTLENNTFIMAIFRGEKDYLGKWQRLAYTELFKRLGMKIEFRGYPPKRASIEADAGNVDGEAGRIIPYAAEHPNLIRIEESLCHLKFSAFAAQNSIPTLNGWESFKGTNYKVECQLGITACEVDLPKFVSKENLSYVQKPEYGMKKLILGRTDLFVYDEADAMTLLQTPEFKDSKIHFVGVMEIGTLYPYLHKKHASLVPKMTEIIKAMKAEGLIDQYRVMLDKEFGIVRK